MVGRCRHRFWLNFWSADDFFVETPKLKVSLTDPPIFIGFVIGEASGDGRPMIDRRLEEFCIMISVKGRQIIGRQSADDRQTVGRRGLTKNRRQRDAHIGRHSADGCPTVGRSLNVIYVIFFIMHVSTLCMKLNHELTLFWDSFHWTLCTNII